MPVDTSWFRARLGDHGLSQRGAARLLGLDPAALSLTLRGRRAMKLTEAAELARLLGVPIEDVLARAGVEAMTGGMAIPVAGWMDGMCEIHLDAELGTVPHPGGDLAPGSSAIQSRTAGTPLDYMDGWLIFAGPPVERGAADHTGRLCLVRMARGVTYLAQLRRGYRRGHWNLNGPAASMNDVALDWSAPVSQILT